MAWLDRTWWLTLVSCLLSALPSIADDVPFTLAIEGPFSLPDAHESSMPGLQSFCVGRTVIDETTYWLLAAGRTEGLHGFDGRNPANNFPDDKANRSLWVVEPVSRKFWTAPVTALSRPIAEALSVTNAQSCQVGDVLFIFGGYGKQTGSKYTGNMTTFDTVTAIQVTATVKAIIAGGTFTEFVKQASDPRFRVTGGGVECINGIFCLAVGQIFDGLYSPAEGATGNVFNQIYTQQVRYFTLSPDLAITNYAMVDFNKDPKLEFHRRDLTVASTVSPTGTPLVALYGGVFNPMGPQQFAGYTHPVYADPTNRSAMGVTVDTSFEQLLSQYDCAHLTILDDASNTVHTIFFGGISQYHFESPNLVWDATDMSRHLDGLPFIKSISGFSRAAGGSEGYILGISMPDYEGSETQLLLNPGAHLNDQDVVLLSKLTGEPITIGYLFGGILSQTPYAAQAPSAPSTIASDRFYTVTLSAKESTVTPMPPKPTATTPVP